MTIVALLIPGSIAAESAQAQTTISSGQIDTSTAVGSGTVTFNGGTLQADGTTTSLSNSILINTTGGTVDTDANTLTLSGVIATAVERPPVL